MKVKVLKDEIYGHKGKRHEIKAGVHDLPDFVAQSWLDQGRCESCTKAKAKSPVTENKAVQPVEENKATPAKKKTTAKKPKAKPKAK